jgi:hypothetical protein
MKMLLATATVFVTLASPVLAESGDTAAPSVSCSFGRLGRSLGAIVTNNPRTAEEQARDTAQDQNCNTSDIPPPSHPPISSDVPAQEAAAGLKWAGVVEIRQSTIGCIDIQDTLNPKKAQQLVDQAEHALTLALRKEITFERRSELTKCLRFSSDRTSSYSYWRVTDTGQSFPELPSGKVATCVTSLINLSSKPTTSCFWVVADKANVTWTEKRGEAHPSAVSNPRTPMICGIAGPC